MKREGIEPEGNEISKQINRLFAAELQFRLATAVRLATTTEKQPLDVPAEWSHGKHKVGYKEIAITKKQADYAAWHLHNSATFLIAVAIKDAIKAIVPDPKNNLNADIKNAYEIARLIRNAFAHSPFCPIWAIDPNCRDKVFNVKNIIKLDTKNLDGKIFNWRHYGGPLAILRFCQFVRFEILHDTNKRPEKRNLSAPKKIYLQIGSLILEEIDSIPQEAKKIDIEKHLDVDGNINLGGGYILRNPKGKKSNVL